jgi:hypothetical protein
VVRVVRVVDEAARAALMANDPAILAGRGLRFDIAPTIRAVTLA